MKNILYLILIVVGVIVAYYFIREIRYPYTYKVCDSAYQDCQAVAKFKDRWSCESVNEKGGWLCDSTDKNRITCTPSDSSHANGICE